MHLCYLKEPAPWEYQPKCSQCQRWCKDYNDEWNGDYRCAKCATTPKETPCP